MTDQDKRVRAEAAAYILVVFACWAVLAVFTAWVFHR